MYRLFLAHLVSDLWVDASVARPLGQVRELKFSGIH